MHFYTKKEKYKETNWRRLTTNTLFLQGKCGGQESFRQTKICPSFKTLITFHKRVWLISHTMQSRRRGGTCRKKVVTTPRRSGELLVWRPQDCSNLVNWENSKWGIIEQIRYLRRLEDVNISSFVDLLV